MKILLAIGSLIASVALATSGIIPGPLSRHSHVASSGPTLSVTNNLIARWESDSLTANDGDTIDLWTDQSGSARDATGGLTISPLYKTNIFGSKPALRFDGANDYMTFPLTTVTNFTVFVAWKLNSVSGFWTFGPLQWRNGSSGAGFNFVSDSVSTADPIKRLMIWNSGGSVVGNKAGPDESLNMPTTSRGKAVDTWRWDGTTCTMRKNGADQTVTSATYSFGAPSGAQNFGSPYNSCAADIAAILVYCTNLSDDDVLTVETYLNAKYPCF